MTRRRARIEKPARMVAAARGTSCRPPARRHGICINVRFHTFPDFAEIVGIEAIVASKRLPLPRLADFLFARKAISAKVRTKWILRAEPGVSGNATQFACQPE